MMRAIVVVLLGSLLSPVAVAAQTPAADPIRELLTEVRALRLAMERAATVGARIQLLVARVQLQEQRITELSRRATSVREQLRSLDTEQTLALATMKQFEAAAVTAPADERAHFESQLERHKMLAATMEKRRQDLVNEESMLAQQIAADQGRWSDVNNQLDELERSLTLPIKQ